jgi:hypothetical protein
MLKLPIGKLLGASEAISKFAQVVSQQLGAGKGMKLSGGSFQNVVNDVQGFQTAAEATGLTVTAKIADKLHKLLSDIHASGSMTLTVDNLADVNHYLMSASECLEQEASVTVAMVMPPQMAKLFEPDEPLFGADVASKFPGVQYDIAEAGKCLSLGRSTATVFHLMRVMEVSLHAVHACLAIPSPIAGNDKSWGSILQKIRTEYKTRPAFAEMQTFQELHARLDAVKDAWRNGTMHVEQKYTIEEAENVFAMVKGFMQKVASRMDEQGQPLA